MPPVIALAADAAPAFADKRVALVMGNAGYPSMAQLQNPRNDAADDAALRPLDFEAIAATDLDRSGMNDVLDRFSAGGRGVGLRRGTIGPRRQPFAYGSPPTRQDFFFIVRKQTRPVWGGGPAATRARMLLRRAG